MKGLTIKALNLWKCYEFGLNSLRISPLQGILTFSSISKIQLIFSGSIVWGQSEAPLQIDVSEGEDVVLECRFSPQLSKKASTLYWIRTNRKGHDNVAIGSTPFQANYE